MSNCTITDKYGYFAADGTFTGVQNVAVYAVPDASWRTVDVSGTYRTLGVNPNITTAAYQRGRVTTTDSSGQYSFALPYPAAEHPASPAATWTIVLPSGDMWSGAVPAVAGPLTLDDLRTTHSWVQVNAVYVAPVTPGTLARGTATFSSATSATVVFGTAFALNTYQIQLTPSVDSSTGNVPAVAWGSKTTTGFTITTSGAFSGSVDWEAVL